MSNKNQPITFVEPSYLLMSNGVALMNQMGHLAIFTTKGVANNVAHINRQALGVPVTVQAVTIRPGDHAHPEPAAHVMNPEAAILQQVDGHWQKLAALLVWKLAKTGVTLTEKEISEFPPDLVLLTHGHKDSIEFKMVTQDEAQRLAEYDAAQAGHA